MRDCEQRLERLAAERVAEVQRIREEHRLEVKEADFRATQELQSMAQECNRKINEHHFMMEEQVRQAQSEAKSSRVELKVAARRMEEKEKEHEQQVVKMGQEHWSAISEVMQETRQEKEKFSHRIEQEERHYQQSLERKVAEFEQLRRGLEEEITMLKQKNAVEIVERRYRKEIETMRVNFAS